MPTSNCFELAMVSLVDRNWIEWNREGRSGLWDYNNINNNINNNNNNNNNNNINNDNDNNNYNNINNNYILYPIPFILTMDHPVL